jgi:hypothetical protein
LEEIEIKGKRRFRAPFGIGMINAAKVIRMFILAAFII